MKLKVSEAHRLNLALSAIARGFGGDKERVYVVKTVQGRMTLAKNLRRLSDALEPVEAEMLKARDRIFNEERRENPEAKELSPARAEELGTVVRQVNDRELEVDLIQLSEDDLDLSKFDGSDAIQALAALDGVLLR